MKELIRNILIRTSIVVLAVLLGMPCSIKREIKQFFNIPLSEKTTAHSKPGICTNTLTERSLQKTTVSKKAKHSTRFLPSLFGKEQTLASEYQAIPSFGKNITLPVPIYILYEQYLI